MLLLSISLAMTVASCSSSNNEDANLEEYADCLQRVMDEAAAAGRDTFDMSVCDNL
jgi:hypothetical protein